jgi:glycosyltransferase involved in cell wall biosynthesis
MIQSPLVTVLINNYNYGRFLRESIDSALTQTYKNLEIVVVDDGSTDDSRKILASYRKRIVPIFKPNGGQASALNAGFAASKGEIICLLDSDDVWLPNKVEEMVRAAETNAGAMLIYHAYQRADSNLWPFGKVLPLSFLEGDISEKIRRSGGCWPFPPTSALAFRRSILSTVMPIPESLFRTCADACLAYSIPLIAPVAAIRQPLCLYRIHGSNGYAGRQMSRDSAVAADALKVERYQRNVAGANEVLARIGRTDSLLLKDHVSYAKARYTAGVSGRPSWAEVTWKLARMSSEPSWFARSKSVAKFWLESFGAARFS